MATSDVQKEGYLVKAPVRRSFGRSKRRFIRLGGSHIEWCESERTPPLGRISLVGATLSVQRSDSGALQTLRVASGSLALQLGPTLDPSDLEGWDGAIRRALAALETGSGDRQASALPQHQPLEQAALPARLRLGLSVGAMEARLAPPLSVRAHLSRSRTLV